MASKELEHVIRRTANRFGIDVTRHRPDESLHGRLARMLASHEVDVVLDVGANVGQFGAALRDAGFDGKIVSFESLSDAHQTLRQESARDAAWFVADRAAIGATTGQVEINVSSNSFSSSVLDVLPAHTRAAPDSRYVGKESVPLTTLDLAARPYLQDMNAPFVKIDTQGYESAVLDGAPAVLDQAVGVHVEASLVPLYDGQTLYPDLTDRLKDAGFDLWAIWPGIHDPDSGRMLQVDITMFRSSE